MNFSRCLRYASTTSTRSRLLPVITHAHPRPAVLPSTRRAASSQFSRDQSRVGVFTPSAAVIFVATGVGLFFYFRHEKQKMLEEREKAKGNQQSGRAHLGGPFELTTHTGAVFTDKDMLGKWSLVYFGFTNCPDICPAELDKVTDVLNDLQSTHGKVFLPLFISVDPARDPPSQLARYLKDFHPAFTALVGSYAATKAICKTYRVYFSTPPDAKPGDDYLVDHSIFVYLMDPKGEFVEAFGQSTTKGEIAEKVRKEIGMWEKKYGRTV